MLPLMFFYIICGLETIIEDQQDSQTHRLETLKFDAIWKYLSHLYKTLPVISYAFEVFYYLLS